MVELIINGKSVELLKKGQDIKYNRQIADVFDIASVSSSYTNSFNIPKTPKNTEIFEHLGIVGDQSTIPYTKTPVTVRNEGFDLITEGWLNVSETTSIYKCSIIDGMVDFFKAIENKTLGVDLDLSNFQHEKNLENIVNSFDNEYYNYIIADFGGRTMVVNIFPVLEFSVNIDYLVPSFNVKKLLELVFTTFGYSYVSDELDEFLEGLYITYPTPPTYEISDEDLIATFIKNFWTSSDIVNIGDKYTVLSQNFWDSYTISKGQVIDENTYIVASNSNHKITLSIEAYARYYSPFIGNEYKGCTYQILRNGIAIYQKVTDPFSAVEGEINIYLQEGDIITTLLFVTERTYIVERFTGLPRTMQLQNFSCNSIEIKIFEFSSDDVVLKDAFKDFKIKDFLKEILYRTGLTPVPDNITKVITFIPISERIDFENAIDWTDKYVRREKEIYLKNTYAQRNLFKMKYNEGSAITNDGIITVNNVNIEDEKTLVQSLLYSPEEGVSEFIDTSNGTISTVILPMYSKEIDNNEEGEVTVNYKELSNRFYFIRRNTVTDRTWKLQSIIVPGSQIVNELHFATIENTLLGSLVDINFSDYAKIFNNFRCHNVELALGLSDILSLDLTKPYYFKQEAGYYILNKLAYQDGETQTGEFVRINQ